MPIIQQWEQYQRQNDARHLRAMEEGACYVFALDIDCSRPFYWIFNPKSGETYQTDSMTCSCPDFEYRCKKIAGYGVLCKHIQALLHAYTLGEVLSLAEVYDTPEWKAKHPLRRTSLLVVSSGDRGAGGSSVIAFLNGFESRPAIG